jgi:hypothetical protein
MVTRGSRGVSARSPCSRQDEIAIFAAGLARRKARSAEVTTFIRDGRHVDDSLAPVWAKVRGEGLAGLTALGWLATTTSTPCPLRELTFS